MSAVSSVWGHLPLALQRLCTSKVLEECWEEQCLHAGVRWPTSRAAAATCRSGAALLSTATTRLHQRQHAQVAACAVTRASEEAPKRDWFNLPQEQLGQMSLAAATLRSAASLNIQGSHVWHVQLTALSFLTKPRRAVPSPDMSLFFPCGPAAVAQNLGLCRPHRLCIFAHSGSRKSTQTLFKHGLASAQRGNREPATFNCVSG